jgi:hypothetical protein
MLTCGLSRLNLSVAKGRLVVGVRVGVGRRRRLSVLFVRAVQVRAMVVLLLV